MLYQLLIPPLLIIPVLIITTKCQLSSPNRENSDVIVSYSNHAEADAPEKAISEAIVKSTVIPLLKYEYYTKTTIAPVTESVTNEDDVIFLPNNKEAQRNEEYLQHEAVDFERIMGKKTVADLAHSKDVRLETESPNADIFFVAGKNNENDESPAKLRNDPGPIQSRLTTPAPKLNCSNLDCSNTLESVCGGKVDEHKQWRYRLFMNECYLRKVNCNFQKVYNRYRQVSIDMCRNIGAHLSERPFVFNRVSKLISKPVHMNNTRRRSSRRAMARDIDGQYCEHECPVSCTADYAPECAVSATGRHRVFVNHCSMDYNSCSYSVVWFRRPLSECVGGKKADMQQNRGFIGWMQRVGIVDKKGRLVLS